MIEDIDYICRFALTKKFEIRPRTIFVEGLTDVGLFELAANLEREQTGIDLLGKYLAIIAAGDGEAGGTRGVCRELVSFKNMATGCLLPNGRPKYKFIGLLDNDRAGRQAISDVRKTDISILEFKDIFKLWPVMPSCSNRDPDSIRRSVEQENTIYKNLDWELEDLIPATLIEAFLGEYPTALIRKIDINGKVHYEWTQDGKARLHRFVKLNAIHSDMLLVIQTLRVIWQYLGIKSE